MDTGHPDMVYQIRVKGHLGPDWSAWFTGLQVRNLANGYALITVRVTDQAALHGILNRIAALNLPLVSVNPDAPDA